MLVGHHSWMKDQMYIDTLPGTNISLSKAVLKMSFLFPRWDMLIPWRVLIESVTVPPCLLYDFLPLPFIEIIDLPGKTTVLSRQLKSIATESR